MSETKFRTIEPKILYFGTPVVLISSLNEDGETNLAPICSTRRRQRTTCGGAQSVWSICLRRTCGNTWRSLLR